MIIHVFPCVHPYHSARMIENILKNSTVKPYFLLKGDCSSDLDRYYAVFEKYSFSDYQFIIRRKNKLFLLCYYIQILLALFRKRKNAILFHSLPSVYLIFILNLFANNINGVCWSTRFVDKKSRNMLFFKKRVINMYREIVCLVSEDKNDLYRFYNYIIRFVIPYATDENKYKFCDEVYCEKKAEYTNILLGNNVWKVDYYIRDIECIKEISLKKTSLTCMMNYGNCSLDKIEELESLGIKYWGKDRFFLLTDFLSIDDYYLLLKKTDIYICSWETQTGLGAIYTCLVYGVKCFLDGANYNIMSELGCVVFKITDLKILSVKEIITPLTMEQQKKNAAIIKEWLNSDRINAMWNNFYSLINDDV